MQVVRASMRSRQGLGMMCWVLGVVVVITVGALIPSCVQIPVSPLVGCGTISGRVTQDARVTEGCYIVSSSIFVTNGATLILDPGVTLIFTQSTNATVSSDGRLSAVGTEDKPIVLTGEEKIRGFWGGLKFDNSNSTTNRLEYVTVEYGGGTFSGNVEVEGLSTSPSRVAIGNCIFRNSGSYGFSFERDVIIDEFAAVTSTDNASGPATMDISQVGNLHVGSIYHGNDNDVIEVTGGTLTTDVHFPIIDVPYRIANNVRVSSTLSLSPGITLIFAQGRELSFDTDGQFSAVGTDAQPILLTGEEKTRGFWGGVRFTNSNSATNQLNYVTIEYGGGTWDGNLFLDGISTDPTQISISDCTFRESAGYGFAVDDDVNITAFSQVTSTGNALGAGVMTANTAGFLEDSGTFSGNDVDIIEIDLGNVVTDQTWPGIDARYFVMRNIRVSASLTLVPGVEIVFAGGTEMTVDDDGRLRAVGTADAPILFTGDEATPGFGGGLRFNQSNSVQNRLEFVTIEYGGGTWNGNLHIDGNSAAPSQVEIVDSTFRNSTGYGIYLDADSVVNEDIDTANTFSDNALGHVRFP